ncbi:TolC family protein [Pedobacter frigidisoli]|uniref:TolC family protein n=1 Tax=Pedobacter frigidisoli TaxID=2530455 RepID=A0A4R0NYZ8_9SPHI|nr:TolC family protein [Pedobacter frigidisoli]TCD05888.1 TolC family protein [Pedobacter frigidisoli]
MKKIFVVIMLSMLSSPLLMAQEAKADLKTLINRSFTYFPKFKELSQAVESDQLRIELAKSAGLPSVSASGSYRYAAPVSEISLPGGNGIQIVPKNNYATSIDAQYTLLDFGVVKAGVDRAKAALQYSKDNIEVNRNQVAYEVAGIYYQIAYLKKAIAIQDSVINFLQVNKKDTEIKFKNGDALRYDVLTILSSIHKEENSKIDLLNALDKQYALMEYSSGLKTDIANIEVGFPLENASDLYSALAKAQAENPEFKLLNDRVAQLQADLALSKTGGKPTISLSAGNGFRNGFAPDIMQFRYNYAAGLSVRIPIYDGGKARKQVRLSQSELKTTQFSAESLNNSFRRDIDRALIDVKSNTSSLANSGQQIAEAKEAQKLAQSRFRNGIGTNLELTEASSNVQRAELADLQFRYKLCVAQLTLAKLTGLKYW